MATEQNKKSGTTKTAKKKTQNKSKDKLTDKGTIVYVASEATPFASTGGLGEVVGSLPKAVVQAGYKAIVILPLYQGISNAGYPLTRAFDLLNVQLSLKEHIFSAFYLQYSEVDYYFIEYQEYFSRPGIYDWQGQSYLDNPLRFGFFCYAAIELLKRLQVAPLAVHVHDWPTALLPLIVHANYYYESIFASTRYVLTIHNLSYQGVFEREWLERLHLPYDYFYDGDLEYYGKVNFLKGGIAHSSAFNTVSPSYAHEILFADKGEFLENFIRDQSFKLSGILNGIDLKSYNPATDRHLVVKYKDIAGKRKFQQEYLSSLALPCEGPVLALVSRLSFQKGIDAVLEAMGDILLEYPSAIFLAMGSGEKEYETGLHYLGLHFPQKIRYFRDYNPQQARSIYAACDIYLMPSRFEPCGLGQMIAARYGALPLVNPTGGLRDTVVPFAQAFPLPKKSLQAVGFAMGNFSAYDVKETIRHAVNLYPSAQFQQTQEYNMTVDFSWQRSAKQYIRLYEGS